MFITEAIDDKPLPLYGDGMQVRDWLYVDDHVTGIDLVLHQGQAGEAYNVAGENQRHNIDVIKQMLALLGKPESRGMTGVTQSTAISCVIWAGNPPIPLMTHWPRRSRGIKPMDGGGGRSKPEPTWTTTNASMQIDWQQPRIMGTINSSGTSC